MGIRMGMSMVMEDGKEDGSIGRKPQEVTYHHDDEGSLFSGIEEPANILNERKYFHKY